MSKPFNYHNYIAADQYESYLRKVRYFHGWTQAQFAEQIGISRTYYLQIESGFYPCSNRVLERISRLLKVSVRRLRKKMTGRRFLREGETR